MFFLLLLVSDFDKSIGETTSIPVNSVIKNRQAKASFDLKTIKKVKNSKFNIVLSNFFKISFVLKKKNKLKIIKVVVKNLKLKEFVKISKFVKNKFLKNILLKLISI